MGSKTPNKEVVGYQTFLSEYEIDKGQTQLVDFKNEKSK